MLHMKAGITAAGILGMNLLAAIVGICMLISCSDAGLGVVFLVLALAGVLLAVRSVRTGGGTVLF